MFDARWGDDPRDRNDNARDLSRGSRDCSDSRERERTDPRDVFMEHVNLPRGLEREHVPYHGHDYTLRGSTCERSPRQLRSAARPTSRRTLASP